MRKTILLAAALALCGTCFAHEPLEAQVIAYDGTDVQIIIVDQVKPETFGTPFKLEVYHLNAVAYDVAIEVATPEAFTENGKMAYLVPAQTPVRNVQSVYALHQWPPNRCTAPASSYYEKAYKNDDRGLASCYKANPLIVPLNSSGISC